MKLKPFFRSLLAVSGSAFLLSSQAQAATLYWDGVSGSWNTAANWSTASGATTPDPGSVPGSADDLIFNITSTNIAQNITLDAAQFAKSLIFANTGTTNIRGNSSGTTARALTIGSGGITLNSGAGAVTIGDTPGNYGAVNLGLAAAQSWINNSSNLLTVTGTVTNGGNLLTVAGTGNTAVSGVIGGTGGLTYSGTGMLTLSGANTYTGTTTVSSGTLQLNGTAFTNTVRTYSVSSNAILELGGGGTLTAATGTTTINGAGTLRILNGTTVYNPTGNGRNIAISMSSGGLIDIQSGAKVVNGGWQNINWNSNLASLNVDGTLDVWDGWSNTVYVDALTGSGTIDRNTGGSNTAALTVGVNNGSGTFNGILKNTQMRYAFTKIGTGTQTLSGANTYIGTTTVSGGTLKGTQTSGTPFGTGAVTVNAGVLSIAPSGSGSAVSLTGGTGASNTLFTYNAGATLSLARGTQTSLTYTFGGTGNTTSRGTNGTLILSTSDINNFGTNGGKTERFIMNGTAPTQVNMLIGGVVIQDRNNSNAGDFAAYNGTDGYTRATYTHTNSFTSPSATTNASVVNITSATGTGASRAAYALRVNNATLTNTGNTLTLGSGSANTVSQIILNGGTIEGGTVTSSNVTGAEFTIYTSGTSAISSAITNTGTSSSGMSVFGPGALDFSGSSGNSFSGNLRINNSTVIAANDNQLGNSTSQITLTGGTLQTSGTFALGGAGQRSIVLAAGQDQTGGTINVSSSTTTYQNSSTDSKVMSGTGSLTKTGAGTLVLSGNTTNTYTGGTFVNNGTLQIGAADMLADSRAVIVNGGTFDIQSYNDTVGAVTLTSGSITGTTGTLTGSGSAYDVRSGTISAKLGGSVGLTKSTTGTVTINAASSYTGATTVSSGKLVINGDNSAATGTVTVNSGGKLGGTGTVGGSVTLTAESFSGFKNGGVLAPTAAAKGTALDVTGTTTFGAGSIFEWNMSATNPANDPGANTENSGAYGQLAGSATISGSNAVFKILLGTGNSFTDVFWNTQKTWTNVFGGDGATNNLATIFSSITGAGSEIAYDSVLGRGNVAGRGYFSFSGTSTLNWTAVPEPSTALAGLLLTAGLLRRRRKNAGV